MPLPIKIICKDLRIHNVLIYAGVLRIYLLFDGVLYLDCSTVSINRFRYHEECKDIGVIKRFKAVIYPEVRDRISRPCPIGSICTIEVAKRCKVLLQAEDIFTGRAAGDR